MMQDVKSCDTINSHGLDYLWGGVCNPATKFVSYPFFFP